MYDKVNDTLKNFLLNMNGEVIEIISEDNQGETDNFTFALFKENELETEQLGYSVDEQGNFLTGNAKGDWHEGWIVIGYEEDLGDPLIVDTSQEGHPVFTAEHGSGDWEPIPLFNSLFDLKKSISFN